MFTACLRVLHDRSDAEDATNQAIAKVLEKAPVGVRKDWASYLCGAARHAAHDLLRRRRRELVPRPSTSDVLPDQFRESQVRMDTHRLLDRAYTFLPDDQRRDVRLYIDVVLGRRTEAELAQDIGVPLKKLKNRRRRVRERLREAVIAISLIDEPGTGPTRCLVPRRLADRGRDSPELLSEITRHTKACGICGDSLRDLSSLRRSILTVLGTGVTTGLLDKIWTTISSHKITTAVAATAAAATITVAVVDWPDTSFQEAKVPPSPTATPRNVGTAAASPPASATRRNQPSDPGRTTRKPAPSRRSAAPPPLAPTRPPISPVPAPNAGARDDGPPSVSDGWLEHRRIHAAQDGTCDREPTTSGVRATVTAPGGARAVTVHLLDRGRDIAVPLTNTTSTSTWHGRIGPFSGDGVLGRFEVVVVATGANEARTEYRIGTICVVPCCDSGARFE